MLELVRDEAIPFDREIRMRPVINGGAVSWLLRARVQTVRTGKSETGAGADGRAVCAAVVCPIITAEIAIRATALQHLVVGLVPTPL